MPRLYLPDNFDHPLPPIPMETVRFPMNGEFPVDPEGVGLALRDTSTQHFNYLFSRLPNLKWLQVLTAGVNKVMATKLPQNVILCNGRGVHDAPTAELAVTLLLSAARKMHRWRDAQNKRHWDDKAYDEWLYAKGPFFGTLEGAKILILGMGAIGLEIAKRLVPFGSIVEGAAQTAGEREGFKVHAMKDVLGILKNYDAVVCILPETKKTKGLVSAKFLTHMAPHAWFVNVGRGTSVDEGALAKAVSKKWIAGAALDVMEKEPLPKDSKLWTLDNVIITPHVAGGGPRYFPKAAALIADNAGRFARGEELRNVIDRVRGY